MKVFIITRISSEGFYDGSESINFVGTDPEDVITDAYEEYELVWNEESESDFIDKAQFAAIMREGFRQGTATINNYVVVQFSESHTQFEPLCVELGSGILDRSSFVAVKLWSREDVFYVLTESGFEGSEEQIDAVINTGILDALCDCTDQDWEIISSAVCEAERRGDIWKGGRV